MLEDLGTVKIRDDEPVKKTKPKKDRSKWYYFLFILFLFTASIAIIGKAAQESMSSKTVVDTRSCVYNDKGVSVKGTRYYTYKYTEVFGIRFIDTSKIDESTDINHEFEATTVVGMSDGAWWQLSLGKGEPTTKTLAAADSYTFFQNGNAGVVGYDQFCK